MNQKIKPQYFLIREFINADNLKIFFANSFITIQYIEKQFWGTTYNSILKPLFISQKKLSEKIHTIIGMHILILYFHL